MAALTLLGLLSALLGEGGLWWLLSWVTLSVPLLVIAGCVARALLSKAASVR
jgi:hypothetical protein